MNLEKTAAAVKIVILGGDPIIGRALEFLLGTPNLSARFLNKSSLEKLKALDGIRVVILAPGWSVESRKTALSLVGTEAPAARSRISVLEIGTPPRGIQVDPERYVPWPCRTKDLKERVEALLVAEPEPTGG